MKGCDGIKKMDINLIWNYKKNNEYDNNMDFFRAFNNYIKIFYEKGNYVIKDDLIARYISKLFSIYDDIIYNDSFGSSGRHHKIMFGKEKLFDIMSYFTKLKINYAIINFNNNSISFENFNDFNNYFFLKECIEKNVSNIDNTIKERIIKIENGYRIVKNGDFIELQDIADNTILKLVETHEYEDLDEYGRYVTKRECGEYKGYSYVSKYSDVIIKAKGCFENDIIDVNGFKYKILSIKRKEEI